ncbi:mercuric reductase [Baaleninema sp.]|uniref:mercuric reductase n=1 Tax=Baaleninema sp. TaxID=3101197 RepID=UPI003D007455
MTDTEFDTFTVSPMDEYNQKLVSQVHPPDWVNPTPADCYDLVVIGAGTAGLVTAAGAAGLGLGFKIALVERSLMGGDCLNVGCVPSKAMIRSSRVVADIANARKYGIVAPDSVTVDFPAVMERMRRIRSQISPHDSAQRFQNLGIDVFLGNGAFTANDTVRVGETELRYKKAVIATGARAVRPNIEGLEAAGYLTNETVFNLTERPPRLAVIGGGPIGCELAQMFQRLGSQVTLIHRHSHLLHREDAEAAEIVQQQFLCEGIQLRLDAQPIRVDSRDGKKVIFLEGGEAIDVDEILVSAGRTPNIEGLSLDVVGVKHSNKGIIVNDNLQTSNAKIFAAGDVCTNWKFTHAADAAARIVIQNTLFAPFGLGRAKLSDLVMPWVTYTDPEVAHVGLYEAEARSQGIDTQTIEIPFRGLDRAITDGETEGLLKILHVKGSDKILGATLVSRHAGETISQLTTAIVHNIGLKQLASVIHPYPTQAECIKKAADAYKKTQLTPFTQWLLSVLHRFS